MALRPTNLSQSCICSDSVPWQGTHRGGGGGSGDAIFSRFDKIVYIDHGAEAANWVLAFGKASIMMQPTPKFHCPFFLSDVLVDLCVVSCA
jgi:hypothetical protein